jgi:hypothetical protein
MATRSFVFLAALLVLSIAPAAGVTIGQIDTFEDGTTQNWVVAVAMPGVVHPQPPENVATGGPGGADDNYLRVSAVGGGGAGSRLSVLNLSQWGGDYLAAGVGTIAMDVRNFGNTDLYLRLLIADPGAGPPQNVAITDSVLVGANTDWMRIMFNVSPGALTAIDGTVNAALSGATELRIFHNQDLAFPPPAVVAELGVDNIAAIPEPSTAILMGVGLLLTAARLRRRLQP